MKTIKKLIPIFLITVIFILCVIGILKLGKSNDQSLLRPTVQPLTPIPSEIPVTSNKQSTPSEKADMSTNDRAREILNTMSLEEKIGQMFFVRCDSTTAVEDIKEYFLGGFILFANDFKDQNKETMISIINSYQEATAIPLLIGVDEEGGSVVRISKYQTFRDQPFLSPRSLYDEGGFQRIIEDTNEKSELLKEIGINVNLAPVSDVSLNNTDYIYERTLGLPARDTAEYVKVVVETMNKWKIGSVLKHFPGYGNNINTHTGISYDDRSYDTFLQSEFVPFQSGIKAKAGAVLVSHNIVSCMDKELPASLSKEVHQILRKELSFDGVIMTDDLYMDAITAFTNGEAAAVLAVNAGNDLLIATDYRIQIPAVINAVKHGEIKEETIDEAVVRILTWKIQLGLMEE